MYACIYMTLSIPLAITFPVMQLYILQIHSFNKYVQITLIYQIQFYFLEIMNIKLKDSIPFDEKKCQVMLRQF